MFGRFLAFYFRKKTRDRGPHTEEPEPLLLKPPLFFSEAQSSARTAGGRGCLYDV